MKSLTHIEALAKTAASGSQFVVVTIIESTGSTPQDAGGKMIVNSTGRAHGTVGGGKIEARAIEHAKELLGDSERSREIVDWNLQRDIGMTCGGLMKLFFEVYNRSEWSVVVYGAGHVAQALVKTLLTLTCHVTCVDSRAEWIERLPQSPNLTTICTDDLAGHAATLSAKDYIVCMTMGHSTDRPVLSSIFANQIRPAFLGVIGSRSKRGALLRELKSDGIDAETAGQFLCPVGLPIGNNQPAEIAISIAAQLIQHRDQQAS